MESKLNFQSLKEYSRKFARISCEGYFKEKRKINGREILQFSPIRQINLFVLKKLFENWELESEKFNSPYFNYSSAQVQLALKRFLNVLSNNIEIDQKHFQLLVEEAVFDCLLLIFSPYDFYRNELKNGFSNPHLTTGLNQLVKYIQINHHLGEDLLKQLQQHQKDNPDLDMALEIFDKVVENTADLPEEIDQHLHAFNEICPLEVDSIYLETNPSENENITDESDHHWEIGTINDKLKSESAPSLAEIHQFKTIDNIEESLTVNQQFMFIKELFGGDEDQFSKALKDLENFDHYDEAISSLKDNYGATNNWDFESEEVKELFGLISKKYN